MAKKEKEIVEEVLEKEPEETKEEQPAKKLFSSPKKESGCRLS